MKGTQLSPGQILLPIAIFAGLIMAFIFGQSIANERYFLLGGIFFFIAMVIWAILGKNIWWLPAFVLPALGGTFFFGFKIPVHELAVIVCLIPMIVALAMNKDGNQLKHRRIPTVIFLLLLYICGHLFFNLIVNKLDGLGGVGNVIRRSSDALWPILILVPFAFYGDTKPLKLCLHLVFLATFLRFCLGIYTVFFRGGDELLYIPGINYIPAGTSSSADLRYSGPMLVTLGLVYYFLAKRFLSKSIFLLIIFGGIFGTVLGGGRMVFVSLVFLLIFTFFLYRMYGLLLACLTFGVVAIALINLFPSSLYSIPETAGRALSIVVVDRDLAAQQTKTGASDIWHQRLFEEGYKSWTTNVFTIFFGRPAKPWENAAWQQQNDPMQGMVEAAIASNRFEKGLWNTLTSYGLVGFTLFFICLCYVIRNGWPVLARDKICDYEHGMVFVGVYLCVSWILLCAATGTFASNNIMFGMVGLFALQDKKARERTALQSAPAQEASPLDPVPANR